MNTIIKTYLFVNFIVTSLLKLISFIPFIGAITQTIFKGYIDTVAYKLSNLVGDIVKYNVTDEKSKFYPIRKQILDGATNALQRLLEKVEGNKLTYPSIFVAGHSLGSEIAYDALNRINLLANAGKLEHYKNDGSFDISVGIKGHPSTLSNQIKGFITFGSPLDKIAFFLRQIVNESNYVWQQVIDNYHCFKQGEWTLPYTGNKRMETSSVKRLLDGIKWFNYFDGDDIVSGRLDYFTNLTNVECKFNCSKLFSNRKSRFTHSYYWMCGDFYEHIIRNLLSECKSGENSTVKMTSLDINKLDIVEIGSVG